MRQVKVCLHYSHRFSAINYFSGKLKEQLETIATTNDESKKESSMEKLMDLITCVQVIVL